MSSRMTRRPTTGPDRRRASSSMGGGARGLLPPIRSSTTSRVRTAIPSSTSTPSTTTHTPAVNAPGARDIRQRVVDIWRKVAPPRFPRRPGGMYPPPPKSGRGGRSTTGKPRMTFREAVFKVWAEIIRQRRSSQDANEAASGDEATEETKAQENKESSSTDDVPPGEAVPAGTVHHTTTLNMGEVDQGGNKEGHREGHKQEHADTADHNNQEPGERADEVHGGSATHRSEAEPETADEQGTRGSRLASVVSLLIHRERAAVLGDDVDDAASDVTEVISASDTRALLRRPSARLSPEAQYAMLKGYEDKLIQEVSKRHPNYGLSSMRPHTPHAAVRLNPRHGSADPKMARVKVVRNMTSAIELLDVLRAPNPVPCHQGEPGEGRRAHHVISVRRWCQKWMKDFHTEIIKDLKS